MAVWTGVQFDNQGPDCRTFIWKKSEDRNVFFFTRNDISFGEYREDTLHENRYIRTEEMYLDSRARNSRSAGPLPFVCRQTALKWEKGVWVASMADWTLLLRNPDGSVAQYLGHRMENTVKGTMTITIPAELMPKDAEYFIAFYRRDVSDYERAFYNTIEEGKGLHVAGGPVVEGRCELRMEWPELSRDFLVELRVKIPNPPHDAMPFLTRTRCVATMLHTVPIAPDAVIPFVPNPE